MVNKFQAAGSFMWSLMADCIYKLAYKLTESLSENLFLKIGFGNGFVEGLIMLNQKPPEGHSNIIQLSDFYF